MVSRRSYFAQAAEWVMHPWMAADIQERGIDLLAPIWHFLDLTRQGRGNWYTSLDYGSKVHATST